MKKSRIEWFVGEITQLNKNAIIDDVVADRLRKHYQPMLASKAGSTVSVAMILFSCLGTLLIGGGIILIFAYNWVEISRPIRAVVAVCMPILALAISFYTIGKHKGRGWREGVGVFLYISAISCLALISQTYYLGGSMKAFLFAVLIMAAPIPAMLSSAAAIILYLATIVGWCFAVLEYNVGIFDRVMFFVFPAIAAAYFFFTYVGKSRGEKKFDAYIITVFLAFAFPLAFAFYHADVSPLTFLAPAAVMFVLGSVADRSENELQAIARPFIQLGFAVIIFTAINLQITSVYQEVFGDYNYTADLILAICALMAGVFGFYKRVIFESLLCFIPIICVGLSAIVKSAAVDTILISFVIAAVAVVGMAEGVKRLSLGMVNLACVLFLSAVLVRFFDGEFSILARGIAFIICGIIFLAMNIVMIKFRKRQAEELINA